MPTHVKDISIRRPEFLGGGNWDLTRLNAINILLGRNGSGKSLLLRRLRDHAPKTSHYVVPERIGEIEFMPGLMKDVIDPSGRSERSQGNFSDSYRQQVITRLQAYYTKRGTKKPNALGRDPNDLLKTISLILSDFTLTPKSTSPFYELRRINDGAIVTSVLELSSGESELLALGMDVLTIVGMWELDQETERLLLVDEPDAHLHPDLQIKFADFLCYIEQEFDVQVVVATHSTTLLSALGQFGREKASVFYLELDTQRLAGERFTKVTRELSAILGGHLLMGPLFGVPILLVEGDDDYRVWIHVARSGPFNMCVLPCNGEEIRRYQLTLERMFSALSENAQLRGIALIDGDKNLPTPNPDNEQRFVRFVLLECRETENLYLTDEVLGELGHAWDSASAKISAEAENFGQKASTLQNVLTADRKEADFKGVINELSVILDPKRLLWSLRLGKTLGKGRPDGMLAEFLGDHVMDLVWQRNGD